LAGVGITLAVELGRDAAEREAEFVNQQRLAG